MCIFLWVFEGKFYFVFYFYIPFHSAEVTLQDLDKFNNDQYGSVVLRLLCQASFYNCINLCDAKHSLVFLPKLRLFFLLACRKWRPPLGV